MTTWYHLTHTRHCSGEEATRVSYKIIIIVASSSSAGVDDGMEEMQQAPGRSSGSLGRSQGPDDVRYELFHSRLEGLLQSGANKSPGAVEPLVLSRRFSGKCLYQYSLFPHLRSEGDIGRGGEEEPVSCLICGQLHNPHRHTLRHTGREPRHRPDFVASRVEFIRQSSDYPLRHIIRGDYLGGRPLDRAEDGSSSGHLQEVRFDHRHGEIGFARSTPCSDRMAVREIHRFFKCGTADEEAREDNKTPKKSFPMAEVLFHRDTPRNDGSHGKGGAINHPST